MGIFFANPLWLLGILGLLPLAAHLFSKARPRKHPFPSLVLLREAMRRVTRVRRPQDRWLLLLRTLAALAIVLAFLQPWLLSRFASAGTTPKTLVIVVDASASMAYVDGTRTRLSQATGAAEEILGTLPRNSRANVIWVKSQSAGVLPEPSQNIDYLREELRRASTLPQDGDIDGAMALARKQLAAAEGDRELCVISDFQRSAWQNQSWAIPANVRLTRVSIGEGEESNVAVSELTLEPAEPSVGQQATLTARVRNLSGASHRVTVFGEAGAGRLSQTVDLGPWSDGLAIMPVTFPKEGVAVLRASVGEDRYPGDDARYFIATARGALPVGVAGNAELPTAKTWLRAMRSIEGIAPKQVSLDRLTGVRLLFVANWDGSSVENLRAYLRTGGALVVQPDAALKAGAWEALFKDGAVPAESASFHLEEHAAPGWGMRIVAEDHQLFALFASGTFGDPASGHFRRRWSPAPEGARTLMAFEDNVPALAWRELNLPDHRAAPVVWWNLDLGMTDWTSKTGFVSFFGELLKHLATYTRARDTVEYRSGEILRFEADPSVESRDVELLDAKEQRIPIAPVPGGRSGELATVNPVGPGVYRWMAQGGVLKHMVVNFPEGESDLRRMDRDTLEKSGGTVVVSGGSRDLANLRAGTALWPWCVAFAALALLAEGLVLRRMISNKGTEGPAVAPQKSNRKEEVTV